MRPVGGLCSIARPACERPDSCGSTYVSLLLQANIRKGYPMNVNGLTLRRRWWDEEEVVGCCSGPPASPAGVWWPEPPRPGAALLWASVPCRGLIWCHSSHDYLLTSYLQGYLLYKAFPKSRKKKSFIRPAFSNVAQLWSLQDLAVLA